MVLDTDVALVEDDELYFRGTPARELAATSSFDAVAAWIWGEALVADRRLRCPESLVAPARRLVAALPPSATLLDRAATAVHGLAAADPLRSDVSRSRLASVGELLAAGIPRALVAESPGDEPVAAAVWRALSTRPATAEQLTAVDAALVLSIDHDLAISTFAARVAASARASGYAVVGAALGAFDSALHGNASADAAALLRAVLAGTAPEDAIRDQLRTRGRGVPGFGHPLYTGTDPRASALLARTARLPDAGPALRAADALQTAIAETGLRPNIDLALAVLAVACGFPRDAGALIFAVGRIVGWIANAGSEYDAAPLRLRPQGRYVGPPPAVPGGTS
jgi:citrate synthase